jgi:hypothetical protein
MKEYRTQEQFEEIVENTINGNWTDAGRDCVEYGFYANDLIQMNKENKENGGITFDDDYDIAELIEIATKLRYTNNN